MRLRKARVAPLYVRRPVLNVDDVRRWARGQGFRTVLAPGELHVTLAYSRRALDWDAVEPDLEELVVRPGGPRSVERLGPNGEATALRFEDGRLEERWRWFRANGASWDFPSFRPHVTLSYRAGDLDLAAVEPYRGELRLGPELWSVPSDGFVPREKARVLKQRRPRPRGFRRSELLALRRAEEVERRLGPRVARAFRNAARQLRDEVSVAALAEALTTGNVDAVVRLTGVEDLPERLRGAGLEPGTPGFTDELLAAFRAGGANGARQLPRELALRASLDLTNPAAVAFLRDHVPGLLREVTAETREAVRAAAERGLVEGRPAREIAREVRGTLGLTASQAEAVGNFRRQLETGELGNATAPWARRLSATERQRARRLFREPLTGNRRAVDRLVARYEESLLNRRARNVARTEVLRAHNAGQKELWRQAADRGLLDRGAAREFWLVTPDDRLSPEHAAIPRLNPDGVALGEPFQTLEGPSGGPPLRTNCRCTTVVQV